MQKDSSLKGGRDEGTFTRLQTKPRWWWRRVAGVTGHNVGRHLVVSFTRHTSASPRHDPTHRNVYCKHTTASQAHRLISQLRHAPPHLRHRHGPAPGRRRGPCLDRRREHEHHLLRTRRIKPSTCRKNRAFAPTAWAAPRSRTPSSAHSTTPASAPSARTTSSSVRECSTFIPTPFQNLEVTENLDVSGWAHIGKYLTVDDYANIGGDGKGTVYLSWHG